MNKLIPLTILILSVIIASCSLEPDVTKTTKAIKYSGHYNNFSGVFSDNQKFKGVACFKRGTSLGDFCLQAKEMVCSGKYSANGELLIVGELECSNMTTGTFQVKRELDGDFVEPIYGTGSLSDGRTATVSFFPAKQGTGTTICYR